MLTIQNARHFVNINPFIVLEKRYLCNHEEDNDLDNCYNNGTVVPWTALSAAVVHRGDGEDEEGAV